jgi:hypothetical protein
MPLLPLRMHRILCMSGQVLVLVSKMLMSGHERGTWKLRQNVLRRVCNAAIPLLMMGGNAASSLMSDHGGDGDDRGVLLGPRGNGGGLDDDDADEDQD